MASTTAGGAKHTNRLANETSPYLLQHQHNPVDWYAWGPEAFERARRENKPIFLSVGYSTCYWCHVMERQSFEVEGIAAEMNARFVNIKVDREERPDVDQLYMTAVQVLTRHGGWPMSVWLLPDLRPFYGGTYFPPTDQHGRPGFVTVLHAIEDAYKNRHADVEKTAENLKDILENLAEPAAPDEPITINDAWVDQILRRSVGDYDPANGGFGSAPKFPRETLLELLLVHNRTFPDDRRTAMLRHTLDALAAGGIRDQLGGAFHRYSTDAKWLVPHFEIMLYDNAMLAWIYAEAYRQSEDRNYAKVCREILDFVLREMTSSQGPFYTAFDAEVDAQEGLSYLWTMDEVEDVLGKVDGELFARVYGLNEGPNFADPHHGTGRPDKNVLFLAERLAQVAKSIGVTEAELELRIDALRQKLYVVRGQRKQPLLDTKILTSWNALMIRAMAYAGQVLNEPRYQQAATVAADFLLQHHRKPDGGLLRTSRDGAAKYDAFLDDYAFLAQALLALWQSTGQDRWRETAREITQQMRTRFADDASTSGGFYFTDASAQDLIVRQMVGTDSPLPAGNAVAAMVLLELGDADAARTTLATFADPMNSQGESMSAMVEAAHLYLRQYPPFTVSQSTEPTNDRPPEPQDIAAGIVKVAPAWVSETQLNLHLDVLDGFHINAHAAAPGLIPTDVQIAEAPVQRIDYPPGETQSFAFSDQPIKVYGGQVVISVLFNERMIGKSPVLVGVRYQACNDEACLPSVQRWIEVPTP
jgi:uncharacterized protein YyaL (SSP411 family)